MPDGDAPGGKRLMYPREPRSTATARVAARASRAHSFRSERGFTLIEVLAACAVISIGVASTLKTFGATGRTVTRSERTQVAIQRAQSELDRMRTIPYGELALTSTSRDVQRPEGPRHPGRERRPEDPDRPHRAVRHDAGREQRGARRSGAARVRRGTQRGHGHRSRLPLCDVAERELPGGPLRGQREHQAADRRGHPRCAAERRQAHAHLALDGDLRSGHRPTRYPGTPGRRPWKRRSR